MNKKHLIVIVGPTGVGKTEFTVKLALKLGSMVLNADSRQVFKELSIGTDKPSKEEMLDVPHFFVSDRSITSNFSAGHFEKEGLEILKTIYTNNNIAILSGGSGLYIDALCYGLSIFPKIDTKIRLLLKSRVHREGIECLYAELVKLDPVYASSISSRNTQRIIRALEVCLQSKRTFSSFRTGPTQKRDFSLHFIGLELPKKVLYHKINQRVDSMVDQGLFEEARVNEQYKSYNALQTVGYSEIFSYYEGKYDKEEAIRLIKRNSRRYAKRQLSWFKKNELIHWFSPEQRDEIYSLVNTWIVG